MLETVLAMPGQEMRVRPFTRPGRSQCAAALVDDRSDAVDIVSLPGNQDLEIVLQADQAAVEQCAVPKVPDRC